MVARGYDNVKEAAKHLNLSTDQVAGALDLAATSLLPAIGAQVLHFRRLAAAKGFKA